MAKLDDTEDLDALIDRAVDTFFVEEPGPDERAELEESPGMQAPTLEPEPVSPADSADPSFDEAVDTLFMSSFEDEPPPQDDFAAPTASPNSYQQASPTPEDFSVPGPSQSSNYQTPEPPQDFGTSTFISSGDADTDRAIDLAVDTLFVEEPETPAPETTQLEVSPAEPLLPPESPASPPPDEEMHGKASTGSEPVFPEEFQPEEQRGPDYDEAMAHEIQRHMHTLYKEASQEPSPAQPERKRAATKPIRKKTPPARRDERVEPFPLRQLQEAILTLEWEISRRSVTVLANELKKVRAKFKDNVTVDFAALSMRVVLDYVVKRMSRAHPESIRFLLDVTDYLGKSLESSSADPLLAFHDILTRYEKYKSAVRKAERIPDRKPAILDELRIKDPEGFAQMVRVQALTMKRAGESLADRLGSTPDPENLIRSFRFLVNRSVNRILESTREAPTKNLKKRKIRKKK
jgi:hypothetical protein